VPYRPLHRFHAGDVLCRATRFLDSLIQEHGDYLFAGLVFLSLLVIGGKFARRRLSTSGGDSAFGPRCFCLSLVDLFSPNSRSLTVGSITDGN